MEELAVFFLFWLTFLVGIIAACLVFFVFITQKAARLVKRLYRSVTDYWYL